MSVIFLDSLDVVSGDRRAERYMILRLINGKSHDVECVAAKSVTNSWELSIHRDACF